MELRLRAKEFCGLKGIGGWSAVGGMCQSPYIPGGFNPGEKRRGETVRACSSTFAILT